MKAIGSIIMMLVRVFLSPIRASRRKVLPVIIIATMLVIPGLPASAQGGGPSDQVEFGDDDPPLANATKVTVKGRRMGNRECAFSIPEMRLAPGERAKAARQVSANFSDCTTVVEIGTPSDGSEKEGVEQGESSLSMPSKPLRNTQSSAGEIGALASGTSNAYYRVWWEDVVHIRVNEVKSNMTWSL
jgi:hypothetical protein